MALSLLLLLLLFLSPLRISGDLFSSRTSDAVIKNSLFNSLPTHLRTGFEFPIPVPENLTGVSADAVRFRAGSLWKRGASLKELRLPPGLIVQPWVRRVFVVRQNFGNLSTQFYNYALGEYRLVSPVIGFLLYNASVSGPVEIGILASNASVEVNFPAVAGNTVCIFFDVNGTVGISSKTAANVCACPRQGHLALALRVSKPRNSRWMIILGAVVGGVVLLALLVVLAVILVAVFRRRRIERMERQAEGDVSFRSAVVGQVRVPVAPTGRTAPATVEEDYVYRV